MFTRNQIEEIKKKLVAFGTKDTQLLDAHKLDGNEIVAIVQDGENRKIPLSSIIGLLSDISVTPNDDFINVSKDTTGFLTLSTAVSKVDINNRKLGQVITFKDSANSWAIRQFTGSSLDNWHDISLWKSISGIDELKSQVESNAEDISVLSGEIDRHDASILNLSTDVSKLKDKDIETSSSLSGLTTRVDTLKSQADTNTNNISSLNTEVSTLQSKVDVNTTSISKNKVAIEKNTSDIKNVSDTVDAQAAKLNDVNTTLENATFKNKGYFTTLEKLNEAIPNPTIGSKAYVGTSEPYAIYIVENGVWVDSGYTGGDEIVAKITTDRIKDGAVTSEKIATSAFDATLSVRGKIAPADVVGRKLTELGMYSDNPEYIMAYTDNEGKFLFGIKSDGSIEWVKGVPNTIKDFIDNTINPINSKLLVIDGISKVDNPEYIYAIVDGEDKILFSIDINGKIYHKTESIAPEEEFKYLSKPKTSIFSCRNILKNHIGATPEICYEEYYERCKDAGLNCSRSWGISQDSADKHIANFIKYWGKDKTTESSIIYCQNPYLICDVNTWYSDMKNPLKDAEAMSKWKHHIETLAERYNGVTEFTPTSNEVPLTDSPITYFQKYWDGFNEPMQSVYRGKDENEDVLMTEEEVIQMMKPYYECIKKNNPNSIVLTPSHDMVSFQYANDNDFFNKMLSYKFIGEDGNEHRAWEYFDAIGIHYYHSNEDPEKMIQVIGELQSLFYKYYLETGDKKLISMPIYIGETNHPELARQLIIEQALGIEKSCIWTMLREDTDNKLFNSDGTPTDRYYKVRALNKMMPEGSIRPTIEHNDNLYFAYWLDDCDIPTVAIWTTNKDNITIEIETSGICRLYNYLADEISFDNEQSKSITITSSIVYCKNANNFKYKLLNKE